MAKKSSALSRQDQLHRMKPDNTMPSEKTVKELKSLKQRKINLSDKEAPEITTWDNAVIGKFYRPVKKQITIRIDADVLEWFKHTATKYQTLINLACKEYMIHHQKSKKREKGVKHKNKRDNLY